MSLLWGELVKRHIVENSSLKKTKKLMHARRRLYDRHGLPQEAKEWASTSLDAIPYTPALRLLTIDQALNLREWLRTWDRNHAPIAALIQFLRRIGATNTNRQWRNPSIVSFHA
jgi:hypothetical protein